MRTGVAFALIGLGTAPLWAARAFRLGAEFRGWSSGEAPIFLHEVYEGDQAGQEHWFKLAASGEDPPVRIGRPPASLTRGTALFRDHTVEQPYPAVRFEAECHPGQLSALEEKLAAYDNSGEKPPGGFPPVACGVRLSVQPTSGSTPRLLWEQQRVVHAFADEANYRFQGPELFYAFLSPSGRALLVAWREADSLIYLLLPDWKSRPPAKP